MGKGKRNRVARAEKNATTSWYEAECNYTMPPDFCCPTCGFLTFAMPSPLLWLKCHLCGSQFMTHQTDGLLYSMDAEGGFVPWHTLADGSLVFCTTTWGDLRMPYTEGKSIALITESGGELVYCPDGHLIRATGNLAHYTVLATRPPACDPCGSFWTTWVSQFGCQAELKTMATKLNVPLYQIECAGKPWWWVHGFGGRVARCRMCGEHEVLQTLPPNESPTPAGEFIIVQGKS